MLYQQNKVGRRAQKIRFLAFFVLALLILTVAATVISRSIVVNQRTQRQYMLETKANVVKDQLNILKARVNAMGYMLMADEGQPTMFEEMAPLIIRGREAKMENLIRNVALAPDGVVQYVYPLQGNEPLIGYDLLAAASASEEVTNVLKKGNVCITPPMDLVQGGRGMNISQPVTLLGETESWGLVAIVVDTDKLVSSFMLTDFAAHQLNYSLEYVGMNGEYEMLARSGQVDKPVSLLFDTENLHWRLSVTGTMDSVGVFTVSCLYIAAVVISLLFASVAASQKQKRQMNRMFHELANTDSVTGCNTRHFVYEKLVDKASGAWHYSELNYSLAILDVDKFKTINDTYGHEVGDEVLQKIAQLLRASLSRNKGDCVIRFGGDEFVLLYGERTPEQLRDILYHVLVSARAIALPAYPDIHPTVSIGGVHPSQVPEEKRTYKGLLRLADEKLYQAKEEGRNRCVL